MVVSASVDGSAASSSGWHDDGLFAIPVIADVDGHSIEPGLGVALNLILFLKEPKKDFLGGILRVFHTAQQTICDSEHHTLMQAHQPVEQRQ